MEKQKTSVGTSVGTITRSDVRDAIKAGVLTQEEERYIRLRYGISEGPTAKIVRSIAPEMPRLFFVRKAVVPSTDNTDLPFSALVSTVGPTPEVI